jgi:uncharacterized protein YggE
MLDEIIVKGTAEARVSPDRARLQVALDADGSNRDEAYRRAAEIAARVDAVLERHDAAIDRTVTAALSVFPLSRWRKGESVRTGWRAARHTLVEVTVFDDLGTMLAELATAEATITGPDWRVDQANAAYDAVRRDAAADARRRATSYAAGLGVSLGAVRWIAEPGLRLAGDGGFGAGGLTLAAHAMPAARGGGDEPVIDVSPADIDISVAVEVAFALGDQSPGPA